MSKPVVLPYNVPQDEIDYNEELLHGALQYYFGKYGNKTIGDLVGQAKYESITFRSDQPQIIKDKKTGKLRESRVGEGFARGPFQFQEGRGSKKGIEDFYQEFKKAAYPDYLEDQDSIEARVHFLYDTLHNTKSPAREHMGQGNANKILAAMRGEGDFSVGQAFGQFFLRAKDYQDLDFFIRNEYPNPQEEYRKAQESLKNRNITIKEFREKYKDVHINFKINGLLHDDYEGVSYE